MRITKHYEPLRYFLHISFHGKNFAGWQSQPNAISVQSSLEEALFKVLGEPTPLTGAGRTDAGVHARKMVAHFDGPSGLETDSTSFFINMGKHLPPLVRLSGIEAVAEDAHARFDAVSRVYRYFIDRERDPYLKELAWYYHGPLDQDAMQAAAAIIGEYTDFGAFARSGSDVSNFLCEIHTSRWIFGDSVWIYEIAANRFLRNMVRAIVGTLVDVGRGKISDDVAPIIRSGDRSMAGPSAPAHGLYLWDIKYPGRKV